VSALSNIEDEVRAYLPEEVWRLVVAVEDGVRGAILARKLELMSPMPMKKSSNKVSEKITRGMGRNCLTRDNFD